VLWRLRVTPYGARSILGLSWRTVKDDSFDLAPLLSRLKQIVAGTFRPGMLDPDKISDDQPLCGSSPELDSLDALDLAICVEEEFGIAIRNESDSRSAFISIASLAGFIRARLPADASSPRITAAVPAPAIGRQGGREPRTPDRRHHAGKRFR
jgi:acyl carrier protein